MRSYDYARRGGVKELSWGDFESLATQLAEKLYHFKPQVIVGIARAGLIPAASVACYLRLEMFPVRVTRRVNDRVVYDKPVWKVPVSGEVSGKVVAVVDEIADTGQTLEIVSTEVQRQGAERVIAASLVAHTWAKPAPEAVALVTNELVVFPWDRMVVIEGKWQPHPEIIAALEAQRQNSTE
ncbi:phosphoribosyltransferase [Chloroflexota bacterium]